MPLVSVDVRFLSINQGRIQLEIGPAGASRNIGTSFEVAHMKALVNHELFPWDGLLLLIAQRLISNNVDPTNFAAVQASVASAPFNL